MNLLPAEIVPTALCYTICNGDEDAELLDGPKRVDIAICNANGYLLEFCNKRIINSCYVPMDDAVKLQVYYQFTGDNYGIYYLIRNKNGVMVIVKKWKETLVVVGCYNNVRNWKIFDFKNRGYPQLGVYYFDSDTVNIISLSEFDSFKLGVDNHFTGDEKTVNISNNISLFNTEEDDLKQLLDDTDEEMPLQNQNRHIVDFLKKRLQAMERHNNELQYEVYKMNMLLKNSCKSKSQTSDTSSNVCHLKFGKSWCRIHLGYWILGVEFWSSAAIVDFSRIKVVTVGRDFTRYTHRFYRLTGVTKLDFRAEPFEEGGRGDHDPKMDFIAVGREKKESKALPGGFRIKCIAVVAFRVPDFGLQTSLKVALIFIHDGYQFQTETFHLRPEHFFLEKYQVFHGKNEISLSEDLMSCLVVRKEIALTVAMKYNLGITLENILTERLGFTKAEIVGENYFIKESGDLSGTCVSVKRMWIDLVSWNLRVSVTNLTILRIFIGVLYNELPMPVRIELDERP